MNYPLHTQTMYNHRLIKEGETTVVNHPTATLRFTFFFLDMNDTHGSNVVIIISFFIILFIKIIYVVYRLSPNPIILSTTLMYYDFHPNSGQDKRRPLTHTA